MNVQEVTRLITLVIWILAGISHVFAILEYPAAQRRERVFYLAIVGSYVLHVIVFFIVLLIPHPSLDVGEINLWSKGVYIHGGSAILIKEIVAIIRVRAYKIHRGEK